MLQPIVELDRLVSVSAQPHAIAVDGDTIYVSSRATQGIDIIDRTGWNKRAAIDTPGMPWGMTFGDGELVMTCGETPDDYRRIRRYVPQRGFRDGFMACPDDTGSHLALYQNRVLLAQWYNKVLLHIDDEVGILRRYDAPHGIAGVATVGDDAYILGTDDEDAGEYWITRLSLLTGHAEDVATVPFHARGLAWDGQRFWTNFREGDRVIAFRLPG